MTATRSARERKASAEAGSLATVRIDLDEQKQFVYKIGCTVCRAKGHRKWSTYRPGEDNGFMAAMDRWTFHLVEKHPGTEAPCLSYVDAARQRLHERREAPPEVDPSHPGSAARQPDDGDHPGAPTG